MNTSKWIWSALWGGTFLSEYQLLLPLLSLKKVSGVFVNSDTLLRDSCTTITPKSTVFSVFCSCTCHYQTPKRNQEKGILTFPQCLLQQVMLGLQLNDEVTTIQVLFEFLDGDVKKHFSATEISLNAFSSAQLITDGFILKRCSEAITLDREMNSLKSRTFLSPADSLSSWLY